MPSAYFNSSFCSVASYTAFTVPSAASITASVIAFMASASAISYLYLLFCLSDFCLFSSAFLLLTPCNVTGSMKITLIIAMRIY